MLSDDDTLMLMNWCLWCADVDDERMLLKHWCCWFTYASNVMMLLVRWSCWCTYHADVLTLLMCWSCWCADPADALILLMHWSCWCTDPAGESGSGPFFSNLLCWNILILARYDAGMGTHFLGQGPWLRGTKSASNSGGSFCAPLLPLAPD